MTSRAGSILPPAELKRSMFSRGLSVIMYRQNRTRDVALAFGVLWYLGYCEYPTIGRFGGPKTDPTKTWYPGPQTVPGEPSVLPGAWVRLCAGPNHLPLGTFDSCGSASYVAASQGCRLPHGGQARGWPGGSGTTRSGR